MITLPIAVGVLLILAAMSGGWLLGHGAGKFRCIICYRPLPKVCPDGRCGGTPGRTHPDALPPAPRVGRHIEATDDPGGGW